MKVINLKSRERLNNFIVQYAQSNFLQSWEWGEFQESLGQKIWRLGLEDERGKLRAVALIVKKPPFLGKSYLYCPRAPVFLQGNFVPFPSFLAEIREISKGEGAIFLRFDFPYPKLPKALQGKIKKSPRDVQPKYTLVLDLRPAEDELLGAMKSKTRYNIRLADRKGVVIRESFGQDAVREFLRLTEITARRDRFKVHDQAYYQKMIEVLGSQGLLKVFLAEYQQKIIAANLVLFLGKQATYLHGASSNEYRNVMAPHLLQWRQILEARRRGCERYDLWGIATPGDLDLEKKWAGITRFKKGFGGKEVSYAGTYDFVFKPGWYRLYRLAQRLKS